MASIELHLNKDVLHQVERLANARGSTVEAVITEIIEQSVQEQLGQDDLVTEPRLQHQLEALERIRQHKAAILEAHGGKPLEFDVVEAIRQVREEQDERY
ncbi:MAG: hypothetical protein U0768_13840 [Anaerolineae bacterium]